MEKVKARSDMQKLWRFARASSKTRRGDHFNFSKRLGPPRLSVKSHDYTPTNSICISATSNLLCSLTSTSTPSSSSAKSKYAASALKGSHPIGETVVTTTIIDAYVLFDCYGPPSEAHTEEMRYHGCVRVQPLQIYKAMRRDICHR